MPNFYWRTNPWGGLVFKQNIIMECRLLILKTTFRKLSVRSGFILHWSGISCNSQPVKLHVDSHPGVKPCIICSACRCMLVTTAVIILDAWNTQEPNFRGLALFPQLLTSLNFTKIRSERDEIFSWQCDEFWKSLL